MNALLHQPSAVPVEGLAVAGSGTDDDSPSAAGAVVDRLTDDIDEFTIFIVNIQHFLQSLTITIPHAVSIGTVETAHLTLLMKQ